MDSRYLPREIDDREVQPMNALDSIEVTELASFKKVNDVQSLNAF